MKTVRSFIDYEKLKNNKAVIFYFSHDECNVCKVLLPKIENLIHSDFPNNLSSIKISELKIQ